MRKTTVPIIIAMALAAVGCGNYEPGNSYKDDGGKAIVLAVDNDGHPVMLLSEDEAVELDYDSAKVWAASLGDGWHLPSKEEMRVVERNRALINNNYERRNGSKTLDRKFFYWTATECSESHSFAYGPDGIKCYFKTNVSPYYKARAVKNLETQEAANNTEVQD